MPGLKPDPLTPKMLADLCLSHLAENPEQLGEFMVQTGTSPDAVRRGAGTDSFGRGLIDYFAQNEPLLLALCAHARLYPESFIRVWANLNPAG